MELSDAIGHFADMFDPDVFGWTVWRNASTGQKALYGLPMGRTTYHIHVWKSLLEQAGFTLEDIPKEWDAFWSFWCDEVQPAVRKALGRDDIWGVGLSMGPGVDTQNGFFQFLAANEGEYVTRDGRLVIDDPEIRRKLVAAIDSYTAFYRKGCTPPDAVNWSTGDRNNKAFLAQTVVMTENETLSIVNALKPDRPDDYYQNSATIEWPLGPTGEPFPIEGSVSVAVVFKDGGHVATAKEFVRFLVGEGWLAALPQLLRRAHAAADAEAPRPAFLARPERPAPHGRGDAGRVAPHAIRPHSGVGRLAARPGLAGVDLGEGDPSRRRRGHQPRAGGRRGDRAHQADPERVARAHRPSAMYASSRSQVRSWL